MKLWNLSEAAIWINEKLTPVERLSCCNSSKTLFNKTKEFFRTSKR